MSWKLLPDKKMNLLSFADAFNADEAQSIIDRCKDNEGMQKAGNNRFFYGCLPLSPHEWGEVYERVTAVVLDCNVNNYNFKLHGLSTLFYMEVDEGGFLEWNMDLAESSRETNKLTVHVNLNEDYEGGDFYILNQTPTLITPKTGLATLFPSFVMSKQDPTKSGVKRFLSGTVTGLPFS